MKKTEKTSQGQNSTKVRRQSAKNGRKKPRSRVKKRGKKGARDGLWALVLAGGLIVVAAVISLAVISVHTGVNKTAREKTVIPEQESPAPVSAVPEEIKSPVAKESQLAPVKNSPPVNPVPEEPKVAPVNNSPVPARTVQEKPEVAPARYPPAANPAPVKPVISVTVQPPAAGTNAAVAAIPQAVPQRPLENLGALVFVIDDAGNNLRELEPFLNFPGPLTIAVLPGLPNSAEAARRIRAAGKEVFLHQPMEALGGQAPGPGAIYSGMSREEILAILIRNVTEVGPVAGMNNHQGSKITMDDNIMETVLEFCAEQGLHFLDSRTTSDTVAPAAAKRLGMKIGERDVFVDNEQSKSSILNSISGGLTRAQERGGAIMIGHTWSPQLAPSLTELYPQLTKQGYSFMSASVMISNQVK